MQVNHVFDRMLPFAGPLVLVLLMAGLCSAQTEAPAESPAEAPQRAENLSEVREQLAEALAAMGLPSRENRQVVARRLDRLAETSGKLAKQLEQPTQRLEARNMQMQAYNALAQQAQVERQPAQAVQRLSQIRSIAWDVKSMDDPQAQLVGDFWLLQADLFDINRSSASETAQQRQAVTRITQFLRSIDPDGLAGPDSLSRRMVVEVRLALLRLYDQLGQTDKLCEQLKTVKAMGLPTSVNAELDSWYGYCDVIGQPFEASLQTVAGERWRSGDARGQALVLYFWASWFEPSLEAAEALREAVARFGEQNVAVLAVDLSGASWLGHTAGNTQLPERAKQWSWPIYREGPGQASLQRMFTVRSLPRFVLIDTRGQVRQVGGSAAVLDNLPAMTPESPEPPQATESGAGD